MKYIQLKDYQLKCFKEKYNLFSNNIILVIDDKNKEAFCILNKFLKANVDYWYAVMYF